NKVQLFENGCSGQDGQFIATKSNQSRPGAMAIELARRSLTSDVRPSATELEAGLKQSCRLSHHEDIARPLLAAAIKVAAQSRHKIYKILYQQSLHNRPAAAPKKGFTKFAMNFSIHCQFPL